MKTKLTALQEKLWKLAWIQESKTANEKNGVEAALPGPKLYRKTKKPTRPHVWKTRKHPLDDVMDFVELEVQLNPNAEPKIILEKLMQKYPSNFCQSHLRTLQRRLSEFREKENQREKKYRELTVNNKYMTTENIQVIIEPMVDSVICFESTTTKDGVIFQ